MRLICRVFIMLALLAFAPANALAWHDQGHMIVAQVAYLRLTPAAKAKVDALFVTPPGKRPLIFLCAGYYTPETCEKTYDPVQIAVWMDDIRGDSLNSVYDTWHYVDYPIFDGVPDTGKVGPDAENALGRINWAVNSLREGTGSARRDAEVLAMLYHLAGDVHQPLHTATRVTAANPNGDAGGNGFKLKMAPETRIGNLHAFWDAAGGAFGYTSPKRPLDQAGKDRILSLAQGVMKDYPAESMPESKDIDPHDWVMESNRLAREVVYRNITDGGEPSKEYTDAAQKLCRKRLALAGYRLAGVLNALFVTPPAPAK